MTHGRISDTLHSRDSQKVYKKHNEEKERGQRMIITEGRLVGWVQEVKQSFPGIRGLKKSTEH